MGTEKRTEKRTSTKETASTEQPAERLPPKKKGELSPTEAARSEMPERTEPPTTDESELAADRWDVSPDDVESDAPGKLGSEVHPDDVE